MASSERDVKDDVENREKEQGMRESVIALEQQEDPKITIEKFRKRHDDKLAELEATRKEADEIDELVVGDLVKISDIAERIKANRIDMERLHAQYTPRKVPQESGNGLFAGFNPLSVLASGVWGALPSLNLFGNMEVETVVEGGQRDLSMDSSTHGSALDHDGASEELKKQHPPESTMTIAELQLSSAYTEGLKVCGSALKAISDEEQRVNEFIVGRRKALIENIEKQQKIFRELLDIVFKFLEVQIDIKKAEDKGQSTAVFLQRLKVLVPVVLEQPSEKTLVVESPNVQALEHKRTELRTAKQALLELLLNFVARKNEHLAAAGVDTVSGQVATILDQYVQQPAFTSPQKQISKGRRVVLAQDELLATPREVTLTVSAYQSACENQAQVPVATANTPMGEEERRVFQERIEQQERALRQQEEALRVVEARAEESKLLAEQNAKQNEQLKQISRAATAQLKKVTEQNQVLTRTLEETTEELERVRTTLHTTILSLAASRVTSGVQTPLHMPTTDGSTTGSSTLHMTKSIKDDQNDS